MKKLLSLLLALSLCMALSVPALAAEFRDVPQSHPFHDAIQECAAKGITSGYADGSFKPASQVTRAQFCVMLSRAFYPDAVKENSTESNKALGWFVPNTEALYQAGVLKGASFASLYREAGTMDKPISRYDMAQLMTNIMAQRGASAGEEEKAAAAEKIADWDGIHDAYRNAVSNVYALGIIGGYSDGTFGGTVTMNRGQGCAVIYRMAQHVGSEPPAGGQEETPNAPEKTPEKAPEKTPEKTPENPQPSKPAPEAAAAELLRLLNAQRAKAGLKPLEAMDSLDQAAQIRAKDLSGGYIEIRADGSDWSSVLEKTGVPAVYVDESLVVGTGYDTAEAALEKVLSTPSARTALMNQEHTHLSVGYVHDAKGYGGYQDFWSLLYIIQSDSDAPGSETPGSSEAPGGEAPSTPDSGDLQAMRQGVLELVNAARAQNGKSPLTLDDALTDVAQLRAEEIVQSFSHTRPNGTSCFTAVEEAGISAGSMGENIAAGQSSPAAVMDSWMNSEGHRANILKGNFSSIGIGYVKDPSGYKHYWVQLFMS